MADESETMEKRTGAGGDGGEGASLRVTNKNKKT